MSDNIKYNKNEIASSGFTLIELVITILILGFTSLILIPYFQSITHSPDPMLRQRGIALGQAIMDEILTKKWDEFTPNGGGAIGPTTESARGTVIAASAIGRDAGELVNVRSNWDDADDYDGHVNTNNFFDQNDAGFTLNGYSRQVTVTYIPSNTDPIEHNNPVGVTNAAAATDTKRIVVKVTTPTLEEFYFYCCYL